MANFFHRIEGGHVIWALATLLFILVGGTGVLYWQGFIEPLGLIFISLMAVLLSGVVIVGKAVTQKDGFLDGYRKGRNHH